MKRTVTTRFNDQGKQLDTLSIRVDSLEARLSAINHVIAELRATVNSTPGDNYDALEARVAALERRLGGDEHR
jgi:BMFP domain-containing protein YqiC